MTRKGTVRAAKPASKGGQGKAWHLRRTFNLTLLSIPERFSQRGLIQDLGCQTLGAY